MNETQQRDPACRQAGFAPVLILLIVALAGAGLYGAYYLGTQKSTKTPLVTPTPTPSVAVYCAQDAMECPDGSYVGRAPPNCEFAQCP